MSFISPPHNGLPGDCCALGHYRLGNVCFVSLPQSASSALAITLVFSATPLSSLLIQGEFIPIIPVKIKYVEIQREMLSALNLSLLGSVGEHVNYTSAVSLTARLCVS